MSGRVDVIVLGAGPAGIGAAVAASSHGADVVLLDEAPAAGGQVYRALPETFAALEPKGLGPDHAIGEGLRRELAASAVRTRFGRCVWLVEPGFRVSAVGDAGAGDASETWESPRLIVATGTHERVFPFPGWTTPGVIGLAAATILLKSQRMVPGERTVVAGVGPLVAAVAAAIVKGGGTVAAMADLSSPGDWLATIPAMASRPDLLARGLGWLRLIRAAGVPILFRHAVAETVGGDAVSEVRLVPVGADWRPRAGGRARVFAADALAVGHGLVPSTEITRLLQAEHVFDAARGGWAAGHDPAFRTTVQGLYVAGDGAGISGAAAALLQGRLAGLAAAHDGGLIDAAAYQAARAPLARALAKAERFGRTMAALMASRPGLLGTATPETVMCRCEDVTRAEVESALDAGARDVNQLKSWTRCGMGPCQGRMCGESVATLVGERVGGRVRAGIWTARVPLRPVPLDALVGDFTYDDIPKPVPAPA